MIKATGQSNALAAIQLSRLLNKKWTEHKDAYVVMSKINNTKK